MTVTSVPALRIRQARGRKSYEAFVATGFRMLQDRDLGSLSIADLAREAGYSVGAFYARFKSKDEFFNALIQHHIADRDAENERVFARSNDDKLIDNLFRQLLEYFSRRHGFWRAALVRGANDPDFWVPLRNLSRALGTRIVERLQARLQRNLTPQEDINVRFGVQVVLSTLNNTILNRPGPLLLGQPEFVEHLIRAFRLVSGYDTLIAQAGPAPAPAGRAGPRAAKRRGKAS